MLQDPTLSYFGISSALTEIFRCLVRHFWLRLVSPVAFFTLHENKKYIYEYCCNLDPDVKNLCRTANILLRAIRRIQPRSLDYIIKDIDDKMAIRLVSTFDVLQHSTVKIMIPKLAHRYEGPEELQHICRYIYILLILVIDFDKVIYILFIIIMSFTDSARCYAVPKLFCKNVAGLQISKFTTPQTKGAVELTRR